MSLFQGTGQISCPSWTLSQQTRSVSKLVGMEFCSQTKLPRSRFPFGPRHKNKHRPKLLLELSSSETQRVRSSAIGRIGFELFALRSVHWWILDPWVVLS